MHISLVCVLVCLQIVGVAPYTLYKWILDSKMRFNYDPDPRNALGVLNWPFTYRESCGGYHQSPVDINTDLVRYGVACQCPMMEYESNIMRGELKNNGHSTTFEPENPMALKLSNIPYHHGTYIFNDFHLHYGGVRGRDFELQGMRFRGSGVMSAGSEHTIDGLRFEGELHFVFYNSKYGSLENADNAHDGVAIIVLLVQKVPGVIKDKQFSKFLEKNIPLVSPYLANFSTAVDMSMFFNRDCEFYTYTGSTTTPMCHESVRWIILKEPLQVSEQSWFLLTGLQSRGDFNARFGNYRTTQPLNDRTIEANFMRQEGRVLPSPNGEIVDMQLRMNMTEPMSNIPIMPGGFNADMPNLQPVTMQGRNNLVPVANIGQQINRPVMMLGSGKKPHMRGPMTGPMRGPMPRPVRKYWYHWNSGVRNQGPQPMQNLLQQPSQLVSRQSLPVGTKRLQPVKMYVHGTNAKSQQQNSFYMKYMNKMAAFWRHMMSKFGYI